MSMRLTARDQVREIRIWEQIKNELTNRNFNLDKTRTFKVSQFPTEYYNDWK